MEAFVLKARTYTTLLVLISVIRGKCLKNYFILKVSQWGSVICAGLSGEGRMAGLREEIVN